MHGGGEIGFTATPREILSVRAYGMEIRVSNRKAAQRGEVAALTRRGHPEDSPLMSEVGLFVDLDPKVNGLAAVCG